MVREEEAAEEEDAREEKGRGGVSRWRWGLGIEEGVLGFDDEEEEKEEELGFSMDGEREVEEKVEEHDGGGGGGGRSTDLGLFSALPFKLSLVVFFLKKNIN